VGHVRDWGLNEPATSTRNQVYFPLYQDPDQWVAQRAAERLKGRPDLLDYVYPLACAIGKKPLQRLDVGSVAGLHGALDVPFGDRRVFLADPREPERLPGSCARLEAKRVLLGALYVVDNTPF
jgi:hypothetical protein